MTTSRQPARATVFRILVPLILACAAIPPLAIADQKALSLDDVYDPTRRVDFSGRYHGGLEWISDTQYIDPASRVDGRREGVEKIDATSGKAEPLFDAAKMEAAFTKVPGITTDDARRVSHQASYIINHTRSAVLVTLANDLYLYDFASEHATRLTFTPEEEQEASFSPNGLLVAFIRGNNLYTVDTTTQRELALTNDGGAEILNGKLDWVYQEEIFGRGDFRGYWWSPDSSRLAFLHLSEHSVPNYAVVDLIPYHPTVESWDYPKAGDPNPTVKLGVVRSAGGTPIWIDTDRYNPEDLLFVSVSWSPDSQSVVYEAQNREQTWLDLNLANRATGATTTLLKETTKAWVNNNGDPYWLNDGSFLWMSERTGWKHVYHYAKDGSLIRPVTSGQWEVRALHGVDQSSGWVYFSATERSPIGLDVYRIKLEGGALQRLTQAEGTHSATFNPALTYFVDTWSDVNTPPQVRLHRSDGTELRVIDHNHVAALDEYRLSKPEFVQVKTRDGFVMEAMMIKPPDFSPSRRYPVYQHTYAGPQGPQQVRNAWGGSTYMFHQVLAQRGMIVWICDNRSNSGKGAQSAWPVYRNLGEVELRDLEDGVAWLKQQPYVDASRIALNGWSYGGFMVAYALTHSQAYSVGISGGPVTDWRDYDTIYTERYMGTPQNNPEGYRKSAPRFAAENLRGKLLLVHGEMDENVHMQNTIQFAYELQKAGKLFELMIYPKSRHGVVDPQLVKHLRSKMVDFLMENLVGASGQKTTSTAERR